MISGSPSKKPDSTTKNLFNTNKRLHFSNFPFILSHIKKRKTKHNPNILTLQFMLPHESTTPVMEHDPELAYRWSQQRANEWFERNGWMVGCNYIPATAINQLEMWQEETFDPFIIDKEISWVSSNSRCSILSASNFSFCKNSMYSRYSCNSFCWE